MSDKFDEGGANDIAQWQKTVDGEIQLTNYNSRSNDDTSMMRYYNKARESMQLSANPMRSASQRPLSSRGNNDGGILPAGTTTNFSRDSDMSEMTDMSGRPAPRTSMSANVVSRLSHLNPFTAFMRLQAIAHVNGEEPAMPRETIVRQKLVTSAIGSMVGFLQQRSDETKKKVERYGGGGGGGGVESGTGGRGAVIDLSATTSTEGGGGGGGGKLVRENSLSRFTGNASVVKLTAPTTPSSRKRVPSAASSPISSPSMPPLQSPLKPDSAPF